MSTCTFCGSTHNVGFVSTRFAGTDGVSLETEKWATVFQREGQEWKHWPVPTKYCIFEIVAFLSRRILLLLLHPNPHQVIVQKKQIGCKAHFFGRQTMNSLWRGSYELKQMWPWFKHQYPDCTTQLIPKLLACTELPSACLKKRIRQFKYLVNKKC